MGPYRQFMRTAPLILLLMLILRHPVDTVGSLPSSSSPSSSTSTSSVSSTLRRRPTPTYGYELAKNNDAHKNSGGVTKPINTTILRSYASRDFERRRLEGVGSDPVVALCLASTSKSMVWHHSKGLSSIPLFTVFLPSLAKTVEPGFEFRVYVGVDAGDPFYDNEGNEHAILSWFERKVAAKAMKKGILTSIKVCSLVFCVSRSSNNQLATVNPSRWHACRACVLSSEHVFGLRAGRDSSSRAVARAPRSAVTRSPTTWCASHPARCCCTSFFCVGGWLPRLFIFLDDCRSGHGVPQREPQAGTGIQSRLQSRVRRRR